MKKKAAKKGIIPANATQGAMSPSKIESNKKVPPKPKGKGC